GGTHLPDITLVSRTELGFAASRAHHADVGGSEPGSMPAGSRTLAEEGVVIPPTLLDGPMLDAIVARMRNPDERRGDLRARLGAHGRAPGRAPDPAARPGGDGAAAAMAAPFDYPERLVRAGIGRLPDGRYDAADVLDPADGDELVVRAAVTVAGDRVEIDFA